MTISSSASSSATPGTGTFSEQTSGQGANQDAQTESTTAQVADDHATHAKKTAELNPGEQTTSQPVTDAPDTEHSDIDPQAIGTPIPSQHTANPQSGALSAPVQSSVPQQYPSPLPHAGHREQPGGRRHNTGRHNARRLWKTVARALFIVLLFYLFYSGVRLTLYGYAGYQNASAILDLYGQSTSSNGQLRGGQFIVDTYPHIQELHRIAVAVESSLQFVAAPLRMARGVPYVGETAAAVPALLDAGRGMAEIGVGTATLLLQTAEVHPDGPLLEIAGQTLREQRDGFAVLTTRATRLRAELDQIDTHGLLGFAAGPVSQMQAAAHLIEAGLHLSPALPGLLGLDGPRTYLLLMQNNHELRATGGFISAVGDVTIEGGSIGDINIEDSYRIMSHAFDHPAAPEAVFRYMGIDLIFVRDANWSPDFPTTAALVRALYTQDMGAPVDGIIAIDLHAVQRLVAAVGPLEVEGADEPVTGENFVDQVIHFWETPLETGDTQESAGLGDWWRQRKDFMPALAEAALEKLRSGRVNPLALAHSTVGSLDSGSIQLWLSEPGVAETLNRFGWSGRIAAQPGEDYLAPVDSNMGYNKVDAVLTRRLQYQVEWASDERENNETSDTAQGRDLEGRTIATATLHYSHPTAAPGHVCDPEPRYGENYSDMTQRCYFNFVRLYVPRGSELIAIEGVDADSIELQNQLGPNNTDVFGGYFIMEPGTLHQVRFVYALPASITPEDYRLTIRRQSGTNPLPVEARAGASTLSETLEKTHLTWTPSP